MRRAVVTLLAALLFITLLAPTARAEDDQRGVVSGRVTLEDGASAAFATVYAIPRGSRTCCGTSELYTSADADGEWHLALSPGSYTFRATVGGGLFAQDRWWRDAASQDEATYVEVGSVDRPDIDIELPLTARVVGTVRDSAGQPVGNADVTAIRLGSDGRQYTTAQTDDDGQYVLSGLRPGDYRISFAAAGFATEYAHGEHLEAEATPFSVTEDTSELDVSLSALGTVAGRLSTTDGGPLDDDEVWVNLEPDTPGFPDATVHVVGGRWSASVAPGTYRVHFVTAAAGGPTTSDGYTGEWWKNAPDRQASRPVPLAEGGAVTGIDAALAPAAHITGTVTGLPGRPLGPTVYVVAYRRGSDGVFDRSGAVDAGSDGTYDIGGLEPGTYRVRFGDSGVDAMVAGEWYGHSASLDTAQDVVVPEGETVTGVDGGLVRTGSIGGRVTDEAGRPATGVHVYLSGQEFASIDQTYTDADGRYRFDGLDSSAYLLQFSPDPPLLSEYWKDAYDYEQATFIPIRGDERSGVDVTLSVGARISGTVRTSRGDAPEQPSRYRNVVVYHLVDGAWKAAAGAVTDAVGHYEVSGLRAGTYRVEFVGSGDQTGHWWRTGHEVASATDIVLEKEEARTGIDADLVEGGHLSGRMSDQSGAASPGVVYLVPVEVQGTFYPSPIYADASGSWTVDGLPAGRYRIQFFGGDALLPQWWDHGFEPGEATDVLVGEGEHVTGLDVTMTPGVSLSGSVHDGQGRPRSDVWVSAHRRAADGEWSVISTVASGPDGSWTVTSLPPGTYRVGFDLQRRAGQAPVYYGDAYEIDDASDVVLDDTDVGGLEFTLRDGGHIRGRVTGPGGSGLPDRYVHAIRVLPAASPPVLETSLPFVSAPVTESGDYDLGPLPAGTYLVREGDPTDSGRYYGGSISRADAIRVRVGPDDDVTGVDIAEPAPSTLAGTVTGPDGAPVAGRQVVALRPYDDGWVLRTAVTDASGKYRLVVPPAAWFVMYPSYQGRPSAWYGGATAADRAAVTTSPGATTSGIDLHLTRGTTVTGVVRDKAGRPVADVQVALRDNGVPPSVPNADLPTTRTDANGAFVFELVPRGSFDLMAGEGSYRQQQDPLTDALRPQWWPQAADRTSARPVLVSGEQVLAGHDFTLTSYPDTSTVHVLSPPTIEGEVEVGQEVSATTGTWSSEPDAYRYQWLAGGVEVPGATSATYVVSGELAGRPLQVRVTADRADLLSTTATSRSTVPVPPVGRTQNLAAPTVHGPPTSGRRLRVEDGTWSPRPTRLSYVWLADGTPIAGATDPTYVPRWPQVGHRISVRVTASSPAADPTTVTTAETAPVTGQQVVNIERASITGTPRADQTLHAVPGRWDSAPLTYTYQWRADGIDVDGETSADLALDPSFVGRRISVVVTAHHPDRLASSSTSDATPPVEPVPLPPGNLSPPTVTGHAAVDEILEGDTGTWDPEFTTFTYQWLIDGQVIPGATELAYRLPAAVVRHRLSLRVTGSYPGREPVSVESAPTAPVDKGVLGARIRPRIDGTARVGRRIYARGGKWFAPVREQTFRWVVDHHLVAGATGSTFRPRARDVGGKVRLVIRTSARGYYDDVRVVVARGRVRPR